MAGGNEDQDDGLGGGFVVELAGGAEVVVEPEVGHDGAGQRTGGLRGGEGAEVERQGGVRHGRAAGANREQQDGQEQADERPGEHGGTQTEGGGFGKPAPAAGSETRRGAELSSAA